MKKVYKVIIEKDSENYFVATVPELPGCHTQAKSLDTLMKRVREAIALCLEVEAEKTPSAEFVGMQMVEV
ncbi:MAG: type II toxin-antitoxin system HicB family antitoxin [Verrucomicrobia bacterium]|nr:MAG: type II toxin-antitoxin system HicB family antitoxin [Verrucomicrobiota bacterium]